MTKTGCLFLLFFFKTFFAIASHGSDTTFILQLKNKALALHSSEPDSALALAYEVRKKSVITQYKRGIAYGSHRIGSVYLDYAKNDSALKYLKEALAVRIEVKDYRRAAGTASLLSKAYVKMGITDSAMTVLIQGVKLAELSNDTGQIVSSYVELGSLNIDYGYLDKSEYYLSKALQISKAFNQPVARGRVYMAYGAYYFEISRFSKALTSYGKAKSYFLKTNLTLDVIVCNENIALCHVNLKKYDEALLSFQACRTAYLELGYLEDLSVVQFNIGSMYNKLEHLDSAQSYLINALMLSKKQGDVEQSVSIYEVLADVANKKGEYKQAFEYQQRFSDLSDSLLDAKKVSSLAEMQTKYETEKKEQNIVLLEQQNKTKAVQKKYLIAGTIALSLGLFVLGFYYVQRNRLAHRNEVIAQQKIETILDEQEIKTYNAMLEGQEEERLRISTDLHDRLGSMLSTIKLMFGAMGEKIDKAQDENKMQLDKANDLIDHACVEVRRISHNLGTGMIASFGLVKSLEELADGLNQTGKIRCNFQSHQMDEHLPVHIEVEIYRIVQEAVNNTLKHATASIIDIQINRLDDEINMHIEDNGSGFDVDDKKKSGGLGLTNLQKRAEKIGGKLHIDSFVGRGTTVILEIPLEKQHD
jgi:two-component system, NarL family, sensor kinase